MKVLFVINSSNNGGAPKMIVTLYSEMKKRYPLSKIVFLKKISSQYSDIEGAYYLSDRLSTPGDYWGVFKQLKAVVKDEKPDAIISFLPLANIMSGIIGKQLGIKVRNASQRNPPHIYGRVVRLLDRYLGSNDYYTANVCNSEAGMNAFGHYPDAYKKYLSVINNCVEPADFSLTKEEARARMGIPADQVVLTCVGRLHDQKNHQLLIRAMKDVEDAALYCAGDGPLREEISTLISEERVGERVFLLGDLNRDQVRLLLRATDIFLIPSKYEGLSNSLIEAMAYGLPIVSSNIPSFTDFLKLDKGFAGIVVESSDPEKWAGAINKLKNDQEMIAYYRHKSLEKVTDLTPEKMTSKFEELLYS